MTKLHTLVDLENVHPKIEDLRRLVPTMTDTWVFHGPNQAKEAARLKAAHDAITLVPHSGKGKNALDFHLSFYLGYVAARQPGASLVVVANDTGYDSMIKHARTLGFTIQRMGFRPKAGSAAVKKPVAAKKVVAKPLTVGAESPKTRTTTMVPPAKKAAVPAEKTVPVKQAASKKVPAKQAASETSCREQASHEGHGAKQEVGAARINGRFGVEGVFAGQEGAGQDGQGVSAQAHVVPASCAGHAGQGKLGGGVGVGCSRARAIRDRDDCGRRGYALANQWRRSRLNAIMRPDIGRPRLPCRVAIALERIVGTVYSPCMFTKREQHRFLNIWRTRIRLSTASRPSWNSWALMPLTWHRLRPSRGLLQMDGCA